MWLFVLGLVSCGIYNTRVHPDYRRKNLPQRKLPFSKPVSIKNGNAEKIIFSPSVQVAGGTKTTFQQLQPVSQHVFQPFLRLLLPHRVPLLPPLGSLRLRVASPRVRKCAVWPPRQGLVGRSRTGFSTIRTPGENWKCHILQLQDQWSGMDA